MISKSIKKEEEKYVIDSDSDFVKRLLVVLRSSLSRGDSIEIRPSREGPKVFVVHKKIV